MAVVEDERHQRASIDLHKSSAHVQIVIAEFVTEENLLAIQRHCVSSDEIKVVLLRTLRNGSILQSQTCVSRDIGSDIERHHRKVSPDEGHR